MLNFSTRIPIRFHLAILLVGILAGVVLLAFELGLVPSGKQQLIQGRVSLCESLAVSGTAMVVDGDAADFQSTVEALVQRNRSLESAGLLNPEGDFRFATPGHHLLWSDDPRHSESNLTAPVYRFGQPWGNLQLAFADRELADADQAVWRLLAFLCPVCFIPFCFVLKRSQPPASDLSEIDDPQQTDDLETNTIDLGAPIHCTLPMDDPEYREIAIDFVKRLDVRLLGMLSMVQSMRFSDLENEAHWLKGAGGTVGFPALTQPAMELMNQARQNESQRCQELLGDLLDLRQRMVVPESDASPYTRSDQGLGS
ncbi:Hpt domain-containing protein [Stieleria sp. TO1_6]|uniref:Hpt domain-containing protein n=1 Tax=Stieleria tagensis TaxID=2956795 RepID=UPI00209B05AD|nr:Hpt domain-containing protein [Stieleria tagensis]MCO8122904.1 Hpt domain-containing protein [Stieleria tagensis]